jgi:hypothetical protein
MAYSTSSFEKRGFRMTPIFNGLQPLKMLVHPCTKFDADKTRILGASQLPAAPVRWFFGPTQQ